METETASIYEAFFSAFFAPAFAFVSISFDTRPPFNHPMFACSPIINGFKKKNNGITEAIQYAIANGRPQKEIEALQKGQKTVLDKIRNLVYEDKGLDAVLKLEEENIKKKW